MIIMTSAILAVLLALVFLALGTAKILALAADARAGRGGRVLRRRLSPHRRARDRRRGR